MATITVHDPRGCPLRLTDETEVDRVAAVFQYAWAEYKFWLTPDGEFVATPRAPH